MTYLEWKVRNFLRTLLALPVRLAKLASRPKVRGAVIYRVNGRWIVGSTLQCVDGYGLDRNAREVASPVTELKLEAVLRPALAGSRRFVAAPRRHEWESSFTPFLKTAGVSSHRAFMKDARRIAVREADGRIEVMPSTNLGAKRGFEGRPSDAVVLTAGDVAGAAKAAFAMLSDDAYVDT